MQNFIKNILNDIRVDLTEVFDRNFENKRFFKSEPWAPVKKPVPQGSLLVRTGAMRSSIKSSIQDESIVFSSSKPYTQIHNEGGKINRISSKGKNYTVTIPKRQFIGDSPEVSRIIQENVTEKLPGFVSDYLKNHFKNGNG